MKLKSILFITISLVLCLILSACGSLTNIASVDSLIVPPTYYPEYESLVETFTKLIGSNVSLCTPLGGTYKSAIAIDDFNNDNFEDALICFNNSDDNTIKFVVLTNDGENWKSRGVYTGYGNEIKSLEIIDLNNDEKKELVFTWGYNGISSSETFTIFTISANTSLTYQEILYENCDLTKLIDIDNDGYDEILFVSHTSSDDTIKRTANVVKMIDGSASIICKTYIDGNISSYSSIQIDYHGEYPAVYIDCAKGDKQMITEMITWDNLSEAIIAPFTDQETKTNILTLRYEHIPCKDVNDDGIIDIPIQTVCGVSNGITLYQTDWTDYTGGIEKVVLSTFVNVEDGYMILIDKLLNKNIGIRSYPSLDCWVVYVKKENVSTGNELFSIVTVTKNKYDNDDFSSYTKLFETNEGIVLAYLTNNGIQKGYRDDILINSIVKL